MINKFLFIIRNLKISVNFKEKLSHNFHELTILEMVLYFLFIRPFWKKEKRFFFEGDLRLLGQMYIAERKLLFETIKNYKPKRCFEVGTYTGGGSTYFLTKAFEELGKGKLISMEIDPYYYNKAKKFFKEKIKNTGKYVDFILGGEVSLFSDYIKQDSFVDCVFLDGAEDGKQTLDQYNYFLPYFYKGSILMVHDWNTEKTIKVKPEILQNRHWVKVSELNNPESVGFAIFIYE